MRATGSRAEAGEGTAGWLGLAGSTECKWTPVRMWACRGVCGTLHGEGGHGKEMLKMREEREM